MRGLSWCRTFRRPDFRGRVEHSESVHPLRTARLCSVLCVPPLSVHRREDIVHLPRDGGCGNDWSFATIQSLPSLAKVSLVLDFPADLDRIFIGMVAVLLAVVQKSWKGPCSGPRWVQITPMRRSKTDTASSPRPLQGHKASAQSTSQPVNQSTSQPATWRPWTRYRGGAGRRRWIRRVVFAPNPNVLSLVIFSRPFSNTCPRSAVL